MVKKTASVNAFKSAKDAITKATCSSQVWSELSMSLCGEDDEKNHLWICGLKTEFPICQ